MTVIVAGDDPFGTGADQDAVFLGWFRCRIPTTVADHQAILRGRDFDAGVVFRSSVVAAMVGGDGDVSSDHPDAGVGGVGDGIAANNDIVHDIGAGGPIRSRLS